MHAANGQRGKQKCFYAHFGQPNQLQFIRCRMCIGKPDSSPNVSKAYSIGRGVEVTRQDY